MGDFFESTPSSSLSEAEGRWEENYFMNYSGHLVAAQKLNIHEMDVHGQSEGLHFKEHPG